MCDYEVEIPKECCSLDQNEEWIRVITEEGVETLRLHDYARFYEIPGLYEDVMYERLKCDSPRMVASALKSALKKTNGESNGDALRTLDFGAGNGMVGECLKDELECEPMVGLDIIPQAREATERDRPEVYDAYYVADLSRLDAPLLEDLDKWRFNTLVTVAALGYGDIPTKAFINAFNLVEEGGWVAFNIKDRFLSDEDDSGFRGVLNDMMGGSMELLESKRYRHRISLAGEPLHYYAIVGRKLRDADAH
jgi:predicted TPR repeat methyltransferase